MNDRKTNNAKHEVMDYGEIVEQETARKGTKIYKAESKEINDACISQTTSRVLNEIVKARKQGKITLLDTDKVKLQTEVYIKACIDAKSFPSITGLARSFGMTRQALYSFMSTNTGHPTTQYLQMIKDAFSEIISENALKGNSNTIFSIFLEKAEYGMKETTNIELSTNNTNPMADFPSIEAVEQKYSGVSDLVNISELED